MAGNKTKTTAKKAVSKANNNIQHKTTKTRSKKKRKNNRRLFLVLIVIPAIFAFLSAVFYFVGKILLQSVTVWQQLFTILGLPSWLLSLFLAAAVLLIVAGVVSVKRIPKPSIQQMPTISDSSFDIVEPVSTPVVIDMKKERSTSKKKRGQVTEEQTVEAKAAPLNNTEVHQPANEVRRKLRTSSLLPPISLLEPPTKLSFGVTAETQSLAQKVQAVLDTFNIGGKVVNFITGPHVVRLEIELLAGTRVSAVTSRSQDFAVRLGIPELRIDAPVAGKPNTVAIEVPNPKRQMVRLSNLLNATSDKYASIPLPIGLTVDGKPIIEDLTKMPHLLVAGATGAGKSVALQSFLVSFLMNFSPDDVRLVLADPKHVEFAFYEGLPHLLYPVINNPQQVLIVLKELAGEMEERYKILAQSKSRSIVDYNKTHPEEKIPIIIVVVDELADIMLTAPSEMEQVVAILASKARAAGIHLIMATQRPSVDVITGLIKANIPHRIAFAVSSQVDSRVILDVTGAERLIGAGDFLYSNPAVMKPIRGQSPFISEAEIMRVVEHWKSQPLDTQLRDIPTIESSASGFDSSDPIAQEVIEMIKTMDRVSTSLIQRRYKIGYNRAARILDMLEEQGYVGPLEGARGRKVLKH
ncbi:DNA translocase FtsK [Coprothermobacter platensis]|uniref:DNA translocase FtsK n=1 Tax=Coprothermobacter platensis TaxID=108819 RepID=UPI0003722679|nr:DNA translocase FtsK [Coprothermobacter platensis]